MHTANVRDNTKIRPQVRPDLGWERACGSLVQHATERHSDAGMEEDSVARSALLVALWESSVAAERVRVVVDGGWEMEV